MNTPPEFQGNVGMLARGEEEKEDEFTQNYENFAENLEERIEIDGDFGKLM